MNLASEYSTEDLNRYLRRGVAYATINKQLTPVYIRKIRYNEDTSKQEVELHLPHRNSFDTSDVTRIGMDELQIIHPEVGCYNINKTVVYITRSANRQWNMAINDNAYKVKMAHSNDGSPPVYGIMEPEVLYALAFPKYYTVEEALSELKGQKRGTAAVSKDLWISIHPYSDEYILGYKAGGIIGVVDGDTGVATMFTGFEFLSEKVGSVFNIGGFEDAA